MMIPPMGIMVKAGALVWPVQSGKGDCFDDDDCDRARHFLRELRGAH